LLPAIFCTALPSRLSSFTAMAASIRADLTGRQVRSDHDR
jgi:hypothetical protein